MDGGAVNVRPEPIEVCVVNVVYAPSGQSHCSRSPVCLRKCGAMEVSGLALRETCAPAMTVSDDDCISLVTAIVARVER